MRVRRTEAAQERHAREPLGGDHRDVYGGRWLTRTRVHGAVRLTGDPKYEKAAKRAFEAVWERRSVLGLFGGRVDAETGLWNSPIAGIGAGMDSFFEYAQKAFVLFARGGDKGEDAWFWNVWEESSAAVAAHMKMDTPADWWGNVHLATGANIMGASAWIDSLSAFWPGLLVGGGQVEEAVKSNLFYTALWSRFSALPERWNVRTGTVEGGLGWYPGGRSLSRVHICCIARRRIRGICMWVRWS